MINVYWNCPGCGLTHYWMWDDCDYQAVGSEFKMLCEDGCEEEIPMIVVAAEESQLYSNYEDTGFMLMMSPDQKILDI